MLPKAHLTSHSKRSASRWVTTSSWLSESLRSFLYSYSVYSYHLFLISSIRSIQFLSFTVPIFASNVSLISLIFSKRSLVFPILLCSSISLHWSLRKAFFFFKFFLLYNIVLVLPHINVNLPRAYACSPSWTPLPPPSPYHPSDSSQCTSPKHPFFFFLILFYF